MRSSTPCTRCRGSDVAGFSPACCASAAACSSKLSLLLLLPGHAAMNCTINLCWCRLTMWRKYHDHALWKLLGCAACSGDFPVILRRCRAAFHHAQLSRNQSSLVGPGDLPIGLGLAGVPRLLVRGTAPSDLPWVSRPRIARLFPWLGVPRLSVLVIRPPWSDH